MSSKKCFFVVMPTRKTNFFQSKWSSTPRKSQYYKNVSTVLTALFVAPLGHGEVKYISRCLSSFFMNCNTGPPELVVREDN